MSEELVAAIEMVAAYADHERRCIRAQFSAGRPTKSGGYEQKYNGKWYKSSPVDKTPPCDCGLEAAFETLRDLLSAPKEAKIDL